RFLPNLTSASNPIINPSYSATLLVACPKYRLSSSTGVPFSLQITAPQPASPGLPRAAPSTINSHSCLDLDIVNIRVPQPSGGRRQSRHHFSPTIGRTNSDHRYSCPAKLNVKKLVRGKEYRRL